ncbi:MAG TPA: GrpB family protein [Chloroflexota bacterium]|nr:GrpB family protein [Chloroflexota bacterium]
MVQRTVRLIQIVPYDTHWPDEFREIGADLRRALGSRALRIDHIGSTAVPGLPAKDLIDVQVTVASLQPEEPLVAAFAAAEYGWRSDIRGDHIPPDAADTSPRTWVKLYFQPGPERRNVHVHVRAAGNPNQRYPLLFRDYLRAHPVAAALYAETKRQLSAHYPDDWDLYYDVKDPVCDLIMIAAEWWAAATGWEPGPSDA